MLLSLSRVPWNVCSHSSHAPTSTGIHVVIVSQLRVHVSELWKLTINYTSLGIGSRFCCMRYISAWGFGRVLYNASEHSSITTGSKLAVFSVT